MLCHPMRDALGKCKVIERRMQLQNFAIDLDYLVDVTGVVRVPNAQEANVVGGQLRMLQPGSPEEVAAADAEAGDAGLERRRWRVGFQR